VTSTNWTWRDALRGVIPPMISPLTRSLDADATAVERVVNHILEGGCSGLFVLGGVGEGAWLSSRQRDGIVRATVDSAAGRVPVLVGVMLPGTAPAREEALRAVPAEPWQPVEDEALDSIESLLRAHDLLPVEAAV
jgi:dihydrodipicolinate synthase/N-acetylneuraminate lyase